MHIHLPKPLHGWRAFIGEVGIIVVGVLIALAAEQVVESWHWHAQAGEARLALRSEIRDDDLPQAYARLAMAPCLDARLQELQTALDSHVDRSRFAALARAYSPPLRTWDNEAWKAVIATGVLSHGGSEELIQWSLPYRMVVVLGPRNVAEHEDVLNLRSISSAPGRLTPAEEDRVIVALEHLREDEKRMVSGSKVLLAGAAHAGVVLTTGQEKRVLDELRPEWGQCLTKPQWQGVDVNTQSDQQFRGGTSQPGRPPA
jgi:hypothetical protein